jgi:hypothetical protein
LGPDARAAIARFFSHDYKAVLYTKFDLKYLRESLMLLVRQRW